MEKGTIWKPISYMTHRDDAGYSVHFVVDGENVLIYKSTTDMSRHLIDEEDDVDYIECHESFIPGILELGSLNFRWIKQQVAINKVSID